MTSRTITLSAEHWQAIKNTLLNLCVDDPYVSPEASDACDALDAALAQPAPVGRPWPVPGDAEGLAEVFWGNYDQFGALGKHDPQRALELWGRTRAELAKPEQEGPTDQEIADTFAQGCREGAGNPDQPPFLAGARAVLARFGRPAIQPVPLSTEAAFAMGQTGGPPSEAERLAFEAWMRGHSWLVAGRWNGTTYADPQERHSSVDVPAMQTRMLWAAWRDRSALGRPAIEPVPVAERLPGAEDCDAEGRCWIHQPRPEAPEAPEWKLANAKYASVNYGTTHWAPHYAFPVPTSQEGG